MKRILLLLLMLFLVSCQKSELPIKNEEVETPKESVSVNDTQKNEDEIEEIQNTKRSFDEIFDNMKILGRAYKSGSGITTAWPASGFEIKVKSEGGPCKIGYSVSKVGTALPFFNVFVDGALVERPYFKGNGEYSFELPEGEHVITFYRDSANSPDQTCKIKYIDFNGKILDRPEDKELYIELIGDSITCGLGALGQYKEGIDWTVSEHSVSSSFGFFVAEEFNADISVIAKGGIGLLAEAKGKTMLDLYPYVNAYLSDEKYSFERKPDLVIVALSANDLTKKYSDEQFENALEEMYEQIFSAYGENTTILWVGKNEARYNTALKVASEIGENVHALRFDYGVSGSGPSIAAAAHPNAEEHREYANAIIEYIKENKLL